MEPAYYNPKFNRIVTQRETQVNPTSLLRNSRKTERGAKQFLTRTVVRAAPFALLSNRPQNGVRRGQLTSCNEGARAPSAG